MATKKRKIVTGISIFLAIIVLLVVAFPYLRVAFLHTVYYVQQTFITNPYKAYRKYNSEYTVEEHIERLDDILEHNLEDNIIVYNSSYPVSYEWVTNIEILYSIGYEYPEYFIIEFKVPEGTLTDKEVPYIFSECYLLGTIKKDEYYRIWVDGTSSPYKDIPSGEKKYYSYNPDGISYCAYKENDKYVFLHNDELNKNYPTEERINILGNTIDTVVWRRRVAKPLVETE